ncbi:PREDICTED: cytochrome P450 6k1-like [Vollenhovia emeryi]|uniref:cytochrome P450 6k1-like n=1 Tax=Vollenhovia emeryi TaxID=411798 RepID=UPI0005F47850|nr:PREDICTED: cytochrome P450 6k1-like [Vollenhovia emeryi]
MAILTECALLDTLMIFSSLFAIFYLWMKWKHTYWQRHGVPTLPGHWFFGHLKDAILLRRPAGVVLSELYQQVSDKDDVLGIYILHKPFLFLRNPDLIKHIMIRDFNVFPNRNFTALSINDTVGKWTLFTIQNPQWKHLRTKLSPVFTSGKLKNLFLLMQESGEKMREHLSEQIGDKSVPITIKDTFYKYTTDVISSVAFGIRMNCFNTPSPEFYINSRKAFPQTFLRSVQFFFRFFLPKIGKLLGGAILGDYTDYFRKVFWDSMDNRSITKIKRGDLIDSLVQLKDEKPDNINFRFEGDALFAQAAIFFVAGRKTSITTMTCALFELAQQPEMQKRVREEILMTIQDANGVTYEAVHNMKYLHQVINETLRLHPPAPLLDRIASSDYTLPGTKITIEKDTPIYVVLSGLQTDPRYYRDPTRFDPERFSEERKNEIVPCTFLPFGEGPRNCIAMRLGMLQTAVGLVAIIRDYEVTLNPKWKSPLDPRNVFTVPPAEFLLNLKKI